MGRCQEESGGTRLRGTPLGVGCRSASAIGPEELKRLPVGAGEVVELDEVDAALAELALRDPGLRPADQAGDLDLAEARVEARLLQAYEERSIPLRRQGLGGSHLPGGWTPRRSTPQWGRVTEGGLSIDV